MAGIYVHVPFCHSKCAYCDFYSVARPEMAEAYVDAVIHEFRLRRRELGDGAVRTLYFGGGTPSILEADLFSRLAGELRRAEVEEFTIEVNPEDVVPAKVDAWLRAGVNRVSMGIQSLEDTELRAINRRHSAARALEAVELLKEKSIANISLDLIYGLPGQTADSFRRSLEGCISAGATHISAYILSYEPGTLLTRRLERGDIAQAPEELIKEMYGILCTETATAGFRHYEISNFARPGFESRHNSSYWDLTPYLGLGPAAHSLGADGIRRFHEPDIRAYLAAPESVVAERETEEERLDDLIMISLRRAAGLDLEMIPSARLDTLLKAAAPFLESGELIRDGRFLRVPERHWLTTDAIVRDLMFV